MTTGFPSSPPVVTFMKKSVQILLVGGEKFGLIQFDADGNYLHFKANTSCAAGTGSFLDQQAARLNLAGIEQLSEIAFKNTGVIPKIASRCAVFAKTDLVHAQQEGYTLAEICDGLCHGLAKNIVDTAFVGEKPNDPVIFTGGVSRNRAVVRHIENMIGLKVIVEKTLYGAAGAALNLLQDMSEGRTYPTIAGTGQDIHVVLLGRPYTMLCPHMNKGIPDIFASLGIKAFYQDMLSYNRQDVVSIQPLLSKLHWHYAAEILEAAEVIAQSNDAYPVMLTSFKCSPDAFVVDYFKKIMESPASASRSILSPRNLSIMLDPIS